MSEEKKSLVQRVKHVGLDLNEDCRFVKKGKGIFQLQCLAKPEGKKFDFYPAFEIINSLEEKFIVDRVAFMLEKLESGITGSGYKFVLLEEWEPVLRAQIRQDLPSEIFSQELTDEDYEKIFEGVSGKWEKEAKKEAFRQTMQWEDPKFVAEMEKQRKLKKELEEAEAQAKRDIHNYEERGDVSQKKGETWEETRERYLSDYDIDIGSA